MPRSTPVDPQQARGHRTRKRLLEAALEELVEHGYSGLTAAGVARRAGVSRGAQQNYFPHRQTLVAETVRYLGQRQVEDIRRAVASAPGGQSGIKAVLDIVYEQNSGPLFAAVVELSLAVRNDPVLHDVIVGEERAISQALRDTAVEIFGERIATTRAFSQRWATVLSSVRGLALLKLMGRPAEVVDRTWVRSTRPELIALLTDWRS